MKKSPVDEVVFRIQARDDRGVLRHSRFLRTQRAALARAEKFRAAGLVVTVDVSPTVFTRVPQAA